MHLRLGLLSRRAALRRIGGVSALAASGFGLAETAPASAVEEPVALALDDAPAPEPQLREFTLTASEFDWDLMADTTVRVWGYNGQMPGPEIRVREGDQVRVTLRNDLPVPTTIHWHGVNVPPAMDGPAGLNQAPVVPGGEFVYDFVAKPAGSRWYHSHADPTVQIPLGLYGPFIVEPRVPVRTYDRDYTYIFAEWDQELTPEVAAGLAPRGQGDMMMRGGELGADLFLMNGRMHGAIPPIVVNEGERILIRLMHAGAMPHAFHTHGHSFKIVATDGNPVPEVAQLTKDTLLIGPAERYDLELLADNPGVWMVHCHMEPHMANGMMTLLAYEGAVPSGPAAAIYDPLTAGIVGDQMMATEMAMPDTAAAPVVTPTPPPAAPLVATGPTQEVAMIDDHFEPGDFIVAVGTTVVWLNRGQNWHSIAAFDGSFESGRIEPGGQFAYRFETPGVYQFLCKHHVLQGMTGRVTVT
jgi:FtsP/CotA-like multicopper oxidase with cupredoxin domain/plastocyanin